MTQLANFFAHVLRSRSALCRLHHLHGRPDQGGHLGHVARHDEGGGCIGGHLAVGIHGFFSNLELYGLLSPWLADGGSHAFNGLCGGLGHGLDGFGFALGLVDDGLLFTFRAGDEGLALAGGDVDLLLAAALGGGDQRASRARP